MNARYGQLYIRTPAIFRVPDNLVFVGGTNGFAQHFYFDCL
jgi:hypothetical protein